MDVGQVSFHNEKLVLKREVSKNKNILKVLEKTKETRVINLREERELRDKQEQLEKKKEKELERLREKREIEQKRKEKEQLNYVGIFDESKMKSNKDVDISYKDLEDDFM